MIAKKTVVVIKPFRDRDGREHKVGDRIQVDPDYGVEIIRDGSVKEDPEVDNTLPTPPKAQPK